MLHGCVSRSVTESEEEVVDKVLLSAPVRSAEGMESQGESDKFSGFREEGIRD